MAEISVELRLILDKLQGDIAKAASAMKAGLGVNIGQTATGTEKAATAMQKMEGNTNKATKAANDFVAAWRKAQAAFVPQITQMANGRQRSIPSWMGAEQAQKFTDPVEAEERLLMAQKLRASRAMRGLGAASFGSGLATSPGYFGNIPPIIPPMSAAAAKSIIPQEDATRFWRNIGFSILPAMNSLNPLSIFASARQSFSALSLTKTGQGAMKSFGLSGLGGAALGAGIITAAATATGIALRGLQAAIHKTIEAYDQAASRYAAQMKSGGLTSDFSIRSGILSKIMGVGANEVMQFGEQVRYLSSGIAMASETFNRTGRSLTAVSWSFKLVKLNVDSLFASIAEKVAPAVLAASNALSMFVNSLQMLVDSKFFRAFSLNAIFGANLPLVLKALDKLGLLPKTEVPAIPGSYNRLESSAWEKMGLVIGGKSSNQYAKETADNTRRTAETLMAMAGQIASGGGLNLSPIFNAP